LELVLDHQIILNDDGVSMILRGIAAPSILARPLDIQKYIWIYQEKVPSMVRKIALCDTGCVFASF
jgi:hypothetical protein